MREEAEALKTEIGVLLANRLKTTLSDELEGVEYGLPML
jgi:hypothetical protein